MVRVAGGLKFIKG